MTMHVATPTSTTPATAARTRRDFLSDTAYYAALRESTLRDSFGHFDPDYKDLKDRTQKGETMTSILAAAVNDTWMQHIVLRLREDSRSTQAIADAAGLDYTTIEAVRSGERKNMLLGTFLALAEMYELRPQITIL